MEKGELKIFFGYSAGVGKTYAMLESAHGLLAQGADIVIGYVEPHARPETAELTKGFESIPLRNIDYKGVQLKEFDVDAAIKRNPEIILVDELAHTNADGSKHKKRYMDIMELINCGISVYTTVNVQHLEGLNDIVSNTASVAVGETVPDKIFDSADEVELVDIEPSDLLNRLRAGKIYRGDRIATALGHFFTEEKLDALREISMRRSADRIVKINAAGEMKPKILVLISPSPSSQKNIHVAARMAENNHCKFSAMYVERGGELSDESAANIKAHMRLVQDLGGELVVKYSEDIIDAIESFVRLNGVSNIVVGKTWQSIGRKVGIEEQIISQFPDIEVLIVPDKQSGGVKRYTQKKITRAEFIIICTLIAVISLGLIMFAVNALAAVLIESAAAVALAVLVIRGYSQRSDYKNKFKQINKIIDCLQFFDSEVMKADSNNISAAAAKALCSIFERSVCITADGKTVYSERNAGEQAAFLSDNEKAVAEWVKNNGQNAGRGTDTLRNAKAIYFPVVRKNKNIAVIGFLCSETKFRVSEKFLFLQMHDRLSLTLKQTDIYNAAAR